MGLLRALGGSRRDLRTLQSRIEHADSLLRAHRLEEGEAEIRETIRRCLRPLGARHPMTAAAQTVLVKALYLSGRYAEAEAEARRLADSRAHLPRDKQALAARILAAQAANAQGRHADALAELDELLPALSKVFGAGDHMTLKTRSDRTQILGYLSRYAEAEQECRAIAKLAGRVHGPSGLRLRLALRNGLVFALNGLGRHSEAEAEAREAHSAATGAADIEESFTLSLRLGVARALSGQGRHDEALEELRQTRRMQERTPALFHAFPGAIEIGTATALLGLGRREEAEEEARRGLAASSSALGPDHHRTREADTLLAAVTGDPRG